MYFFVKALNPRPTFHLDMTEAERDLMGRHVAYWTAKAEHGIALVFGPVMDPAGVYGIGVYRVKSEEEMRRLLAGDPARDLLRYEVMPMPRAIVGAASAEE